MSTLVPHCRVPGTHQPDNPHQQTTINNRLQLADGGALALFALAYVCNLLATPLDDQLTYEHARLPSYWQLPLTSAFSTRLALWNTLNLLRVAGVGGAWALVCYRASPRVVIAAAAARQPGGLGGGQQQQQPPQQRGGLIGADGGAVSGGPAGWRRHAGLIGPGSTGPPAGTEGMMGLPAVSVE